MKAYDYVIAGGGTAGCVLANRLSENPDISVLLVEAGNRDRNPLFHIPAGFAKMTKGIASWGWSTLPQAHLDGRELWYTQAKVIGGGSSINAQIYTRGNPADYDQWAANGCDGWAFSNVLPYFKRSERNELFGGTYHRQDGELGVSAPRATLPICDAFIDAARQFGLPRNFDFNGEHQEGAGYYQLTQWNSRRSSTATSMLRPALARDNLHVLTGVEITKVTVENGRATGLEIFRRSGRSRERIRADTEVVVTCGGIGSARLLLLSGIGPSEHLSSVGVTVVHDLPGVGRNLQDHIDLCVICECTGEHSYDPVQRPHRTIAAGLRYLLTRSGPAASSLFETGAFAFADSSARSPDIQFHFGQGSGIEKGIAKLGQAGVTLNSAHLRPKSRGMVKLASGDPGAVPLIDPNYWAEPYDREMSLRGLEIAREIMSQPALKPYIRREVLPGRAVTSAYELDAYAIRMAKTDHHPVGTCKMGIDEQSVVGPDLLVRGIERLRICDSSIMPAIPSSNTNAPTIMIAEKAADLIRGLPPLQAENPRKE